MRILILMPHLMPWARQIAMGLQQSGHEVHVGDFADCAGYVNCTKQEMAEDAEALRQQVAEVHLFPRRGPGKLRYLYGVPRLRRLCRSRGIELILMLYAGGFALMTYLSGIRPYVVYTVGGDILRVGRVGRLLTRRTLAAAAWVFANGEYLAARTQALAPRARVEPLLIGVEVDQLLPSDFSAHPFRLICTRGFEPVYNNEAILRAVARLPEDSPDFELVFVSGGTQLASARAWADAHLPPAHRNRVKFWGGVAYGTLLRALGSSHAFLSLSRSDGTSTAVLEAMACGLFPILSDIPQNRALLGTGESRGILVPLDDEEALTRAIWRVLSEPTMCQAQAAANRNFVATYANAARNRQLLAARLTRIVAGHED